MEPNDKKNKEPFPPENTPPPPQVMDTRDVPNRDKEVSDKSNSTVPKGDTANRPKSKNSPSNESDQQPSDKKLGESPIEIDDETTI